MFQILINNLHIIGILSLSTLGITLTFKTAGVANFAQGITATVGAFVASYMWMRQGFNPWISGVAGVGSTFLLGAVVDFFVVSRMKSGPIARIMVTLGLIMIVTAFIPMFFGMIPFNYPRYFAGVSSFNLLGMMFTIPNNSIFISLTTIGVLAITFLCLHKTKWGLKVRATASNAVVAGMMGVNTKALTALSWGISSSFAALAAVLYASHRTSVDIEMLGLVSTNSLLALVVGGFTSFYGPIAGAVIIPVVLAISASISGLFSSVIMYAFILVLILVRPHGLFGKKTMDKI